MLELKSESIIETPYKMGLTKQYLRFASAGVFGVVAAKTCNAAYLRPQHRFIAAGGTNVVNIMDTRLQKKVNQLKLKLVF